MLQQETLLGVQITTNPEKDILEYIFNSIKEKEKAYYVVTPNPEIITYAVTHEAFTHILNQAQISLPDGAGVVWAARQLNVSVSSRITGTDLLQTICKESVRNAVTVGFLGGRGGVAEEASECLQKTYPGLRVGYVAEEWNEATYSRLHGVDILFIAYGFPKQEQWMAEHIGTVPVQVMMGVGGAFDFISGRVKRAPYWMRKMGLEWFYRLIRQPWRLKRQRALFTFIRLVLTRKCFHA